MLALPLHFATRTETVRPRVRRGVVSPQGNRWGPVGLLALICCGCQSITGPQGPGDFAVATNGLATAAATGDPARCLTDHSAPLASEQPPAELNKVSLATYRIEPPDILLLGQITTALKQPYFVKSLDLLRIIVLGSLPDQPIAGDYQVQPGGLINLGPAYGTVYVEGLTVEEVKDAIARKLQQILSIPEVSVSLIQSSELQLIAGERVVAPDGTVNLGIYGGVYVAGLTIDEARRVIEEKLGEYFEEPRVSLDVFAYNSKFYYIVLEGAGFGDQVLQNPIVGSETVLDAIAAIGGFSQISSRRIWISRPSPHGVGCDQIIPVNWEAITRGADTSTNYQLLPGDRIFVADDRFYSLGGLVSRILNPVERAFGFTLLGAQTIQVLQRFPRGSFRF